MKRSEQRVYCWIRQQRYLLEVYTYIYYVLDEEILDDLQYDYLKCRLNAVEKRWASIARDVSDKSISPPKYYADIIIHPSVYSKANSLLRRWIKGGRQSIHSIPYMRDEWIDDDYIILYRDALRTIVRYPIEHL
jgi:hypothetical protein